MSLNYIKNLLDFIDILLDNGLKTMALEYLDLLGHKITQISVPIFDKEEFKKKCEEIIKKIKS